MFVLAVCLLCAVALCAFELRRRRMNSVDAADQHGDSGNLPAQSGSTQGPSMATAQDLPLSITKPGDSHNEEHGDTSPWVIHLTRHIFHERHKAHYNVLTLNTKIDCHFRPEGVVEKISINYENPRTAVFIPYQITVFSKGTFINLRDGQFGETGWTNVYAEGNFARYGEVMNFRPIVEGRVRHPSRPDG